MTLYSDPPPLRSFYQDKPTLLVCWWITAFCTVIILLRVAGRYIRTERLFREDRVAGMALVPMYLRMGCVHVILLYGTNNAQIEGAGLSDGELHQKSIASGLVLASRIFYAATLWTLKDAILEYFKRLTESTGERYASHALVFIRVALLATFVAILISTLAECQPFNHYWQVLPDPGGQCRQGYAQLITMATCNILTDLLLVFFPIPMIIRSQLSTKKKVQLVLLFSLSLAVVIVTCYRVPHIIEQHSNQQLRSLLASVELLFASAAANSLVLGSFVRDRGVKKRKFKYGSIAADSIDKTLVSRQRRPTVQRHWGSDEDLVRDIGLGVEPELRDIPETPDEEARHNGYVPAPLMRRFGEDLRSWNFPQRQKSHTGRSERSDDSLLPRDPFSSAQSSSNPTPRRVSFFDVGGLLSNDQQDGDLPSSSNYRRDRRDSYMSGVDPLSTVGQSLPSPAMPASSTGPRRGSTALLQDLGGITGPFKTTLPPVQQQQRQPTHQAQPQQSSQPPQSGTELQRLSFQSHSQQSRRVRNAIFDPSDNDGPELIDAGGLLK